MMCLEDGHAKEKQNGYGRVQAGGGEAGQKAWGDGRTSLGICALSRACCDGW